MTSKPTEQVEQDHQQLTDGVTLPLVQSLDDITATGFYRTPAGMVMTQLTPLDYVRRNDFITDEKGNIIAQQIEIANGARYKRTLTADRSPGSSMWNQWETIGADA